MTDALDWPALVAYSERIAARIPRCFRALTREDGQDVAMEALLRAWVHRDRLTMDGGIYTWLNRVANRYAIDMLRRRHGHAPLSLDVERYEGNHFARRGEMATWDVADEADTPEQAALRAETRAEVRAVLVGLPDDQRRAVIACTETTQEEAAEMLGWPLGTVKSRYYRTVGHLRARWRDVA